VAAQFDAVAVDIGIDAAKTGMLATSEVLRVVAGKIRQYGIARLVVDPVMVAKGGMALIRQEAKQTLIAELLPLAFVVTPNIPEAEVLCGRPIETIEQMRAAARLIREMGPRHVIVKGGHLAGDAVDVLYDGSEYREYRSKRIATADTHGTGCTYSAAIATSLARGLDVPAAVAAAKAYITEAIRHAWRLGGGHGPTNHLAPLIAELAGEGALTKGRWAFTGVKA
jgi:hydroxymethylpyrimidine/phosphomethylpyrimidine kinase